MGGARACDKRHGGRQTFSSIGGPLGHGGSLESNRCGNRANGGSRAHEERRDESRRCRQECLRHGGQRVFMGFFWAEAGNCVPSLCGECGVWTIGGGGGVGERESV